MREGLEIIFSNEAIVSQNKLCNSSNKDVN